MENNITWGRGVSIGPRPFRHGNVAAVIKQRDEALEWFQLGHVLSDMEMSAISPAEIEGIGVSIGPRPFRHGNNPGGGSKCRQCAIVSIGPRPFRHGNRN